MVYLVVHPSDKIDPTGSFHRDSFTVKSTVKFLKLFLRPYRNSHSHLSPFPFTFSGFHWLSFLRSSSTTYFLPSSPIHSFSTWKGGLTPTSPTFTDKSKGDSSSYHGFFGPVHLSSQERRGPKSKGRGTRRTVEMVSFQQG